MKQAKRAVLLLDSAFDKLSYASFLFRDYWDKKEDIIYIERNLFEKGKAGEKANLVLNDLALKLHDWSSRRGVPNFAGYYLDKELLFNPEQISAIVYNAGPGSFVGTRIACTQAQALALVYDVPVVRFTSGWLVLRQFEKVFTKLLTENHFQPSPAFKQALEKGIDILVAFDANMSEAYCRWSKFHIVAGRLKIGSVANTESSLMQFLREKGQQQQGLELDLHTAELIGSDPNSKVLQQNTAQAQVSTSPDSHSTTESAAGSTAKTSNQSSNPSGNSVLAGDFILNKEQLKQVAAFAKQEPAILIGNAWERYAPEALELEGFFSNAKLLSLFEHEFAYLAFIQSVIGHQLEAEEVRLVEEQHKFLAVLQGKDCELKTELQKQLQEGIFLKYDVCQFPNWAFFQDEIFDMIIHHEVTDKYGVLPNYVRNHVTF